MKHVDVFIVGAGIAGISAAKSAAKAGRNVLICDREAGFGGVLRQCAHRGFGPGITGPEYIAALLGDFPDNIDVCFNTTVLNINDKRTALLSNREEGLFELSFSRLILASGCMEISPGMLPIGGTRPGGVYTAGEAQLMSFCGERFASPIVILGSGDLGLIMARQLKEQGHEISRIIEKSPVPGAMARNRGILDEVPVSFKSTLAEIHGSERLEGITMEKLENGAREYIPCRTLLIAVGLKPDRSLVRGFEDAPWLICCGNCNKVYPMAEGLIADSAEAAAAFCERKT